MKQEKKLGLASIWRKEGTSVAENTMPVFEALLLFEHRPEEASGLQQVLAARFEGAERMEGQYHLNQYDAAVTIGAPEDFSPASVSDFVRGQMWNVRDAGQVLDRCTSAVRLTDENASKLDYKQRGKMLTELIEAGLDCYPDCAAVYIPASGRLVLAGQVRENPARGGDRFLYLCVNTRVFSLRSDGRELLVDTVGLHLLGLPDVQYRFHTLNPNKVAKHAYSVASLLYAVGPMMKSGETIDGMDDYGVTPEIRWPFQYQMAMLEPPRTVMAIQAGEYAVSSQ